MSAPRRTAQPINQAATQQQRNAAAAALSFRCAALRVVSFVAPARCARSMNPCRANTYQQPVACLAMARVRRSLARSGGSRCRSGSLPIHTSSARACTARRCGRKPSSRRLASGSRSTSRPRSFRARHSATGPTRAGWRSRGCGRSETTPLFAIATPFMHKMHHFTKPGSGQT